MINRYSIYVTLSCDEDNPGHAELIRDNEGGFVRYRDVVGLLATLGYDIADLD